MLYPGGDPVYQDPDSEKMCGDGRIEKLEDAPSSSTLRSIFVSFRDGGFTKWHWHSGEQILYVIEGHGFVELADTPKRRVHIGVGDRFRIPARRWHRHGARRGHDLLHLAIATGSTHWWEDDPCEREGGPPSGGLEAGSTPEDAHPG